MDWGDRRAAGSRSCGLCQDALILALPAPLDLLPASFGCQSTFRNPELDNVSVLLLTGYYLPSASHFKCQDFWVFALPCILRILSYTSSLFDSRIVSKRFRVYASVIDIIDEVKDLKCHGACSTLGVCIPCTFPASRSEIQIAERSGSCRRRCGATHAQTNTKPSCQPCMRGWLLCLTRVITLMCLKVSLL